VIISLNDRSTKRRVQQNRHPGRTGSLAGPTSRQPGQHNTRNAPDTAYMRRIYYFAEDKIMSNTTADHTKKKLIIIGGGLSGLAAGVYAQKAGYDSEIYERNAVPGGECIGWDRKGYHIDGCIHWLTGTSPSDSLNRTWREVGALSDNVEIYQAESMNVLETDDVTIHLYHDFDRMKKHLLEVAPEDTAPLQELFAITEACFHAEIPENALELMNPIELVRLIASSGKQQKAIKAFQAVSLAEYVQRFKNPGIRTILTASLPAECSAYLLPYSLATVVTGNGGRPAGGSHAMSLRMADKYRSLGGKLILGTTVDEIVVENGRATGIRIPAGKTTGPDARTAKPEASFIAADRVLSATDVHVTLGKLLHGKYPVEAFNMRDADPANYTPLTGCQAAFGLDLDISGMEPDLLFAIDPIRFEDHELTFLSFKHYCYEPSFAPAGHSSISIFLDGNYDWWKNLITDEISSPDALHISSEKYMAEKQRVLTGIMAALCKKYPEWEGHLIPLDFVTPLTYERYCGEYKGQWLSYGITPKRKRLLHNGKIKGLDNFIMSGQWLMPSGGTPVALITGKWAIQRLAKKDKLTWRF